MAADVDFRHLDLEDSPEEELRAAHAIAAPTQWDHVPGDELMPYEEWLGAERKRQSLVGARHAVADQGGEIVGHGYVELDRDSNTHLAWVQLAVAPHRRRQGIGRRLMAQLVALGAADGRTSVGSAAVDGSPGEPFLASLGLTHRQAAQLNRLWVADLDRSLLERWIQRAAERAGGYRLLAWDGPTPTEHAEAFAACTEIMNTAPSGDLELQDERMTVERLRRLEDARLEAGVDWWTLVAVEEATSGFVGFTQLMFSRWRPHVAKQSDTGVDPSHRERGLGRWLKAAMLLRLLAERPAVERIDTGNAGSNASMLSINHALGFRLAQASGSWQGDLRVIRRHLSQHP